LVTDAAFNALNITYVRFAGIGFIRSVRPGKNVRIKNKPCWWGNISHQCGKCLTNASEKNVLLCSQVGCQICYQVM